MIIIVQRRAESAVGAGDWIEKTIEDVIAEATAENVNERSANATVVQPRHDDRLPTSRSPVGRSHAKRLENHPLPPVWYCQNIYNQRSQMVGPSKLPNSSYASSIEEAQVLIRRCAEPRPAGDLVKAAIRRASRRLEMPFSRTRDLWYGDGRRIDALEMDRLRREAEKAELAQAVAAIEFLKNKAVVSSSNQAIMNLLAALIAFQRDPVAELASSAFETGGLKSIQSCDGLSRNVPYANHHYAGSR
jgi:hypothetical protein